MTKRNDEDKKDQAYKLRKVVESLTCVADSIESGDMEVVIGNICISIENKITQEIRADMVVKNSGDVDKVTVTADLSVKAI